MKRAVRPGLRLNGDSSRFSIAGIAAPRSRTANHARPAARGTLSLNTLCSTCTFNCRRLTLRRATRRAPETSVAHEECFRVPLGLLPQTLALKRTAVPDSAPDRRTVNRSCTKLSADARADPSITSEHPRAQRSFGRNAKSTKKPKHIGNAKHLPRLTASRGRRQPPAASPDAWRGRMSRKTLPLKVS